MAVGEIGGARLAVAGIDEARSPARHDGIESVEIGQGLDGRRIERRHERATEAEVGYGGDSWAPLTTQARRARRKPRKNHCIFPGVWVCRGGELMYCIRWEPHHLWGKRRWSTSDPRAFASQSLLSSWRLYPSHSPLGPPMPGRFFWLPTSFKTPWANTTPALAHLSTLASSVWGSTHPQGLRLTATTMFSWPTQITTRLASSTPRPARPSMQRSSIVAKDSAYRRLWPWTETTTYS